MKSVYRWMFEHTGLCRLLLILGLLTFSFYAASIEYVSFLTVYLIDLAIWFLARRFIESASGKLLREPHEQLDNHCDPYPLLEETQRQLASRFDGPQRQLVEMDYAVTLLETGQYHKAAEILENMNIDKFPVVSPYMKFGYYLNLLAVADFLGHREEARIWHRKCRQIFADLPHGKIKQTLTPSYEIMEAEALYRDGNPKDALKKVAWIKLPNPRIVLDGAMLAAKCHISLEEPEKAREKLQYIIDHGNKLHMVQEAREILETLN